MVQGVGGDLHVGGQVGSRADLPQESERRIPVPAGRYEQQDVRPLEHTARRGGWRGPRPAAR